MSDCDGSVQSGSVATGVPYRNGSVPYVQLLRPMNGIVCDTFVQEPSCGSKVNAEIRFGVKEFHDLLLW